VLRGKSKGHEAVPGLPQCSHQDIALQGRCSDADCPPATWHEDRVGGQKEYDTKALAWEPREKLQEEQKS